MPKINLHRLGQVFEDNGNTLTYKPGEPFKVVKKKQLEFLKHTNPVAFRELAEKTLIELVGYLVEQNGGQPVELSTVIREGSYYIGVSPETVKRYVFTHSASEAELKMVGKLVKLNKFYKPQVEDQEDDE
jgi:hypothetical protein